MPSRLTTNGRRFLCIKVLTFQLAHGSLAVPDKIAQYLTGSSITFAYVRRLEAGTDFDYVAQVKSIYTRLLVKHEMSA